MNVWLDITSEVFKGGQQMYIQMKASPLCSQFNIYIVKIQIIT